MLDLNDIEKPVVGDGDAFGTYDRTFAEYACARADSPALTPTNVTFEQAAAVPASAFAASQGLRDSGQVNWGMVMAIGAGGGVGTFAVQVTKARNA